MEAVVKKLYEEIKDIDETVLEAKLGGETSTLAYEAYIEWAREFKQEVKTLEKYEVIDNKTKWNLIHEANRNIACSKEEIEKLKGNK